MDSIKLQLPASTSNCGPGFDTLGIALTLYNFVEVRRTEPGKFSLESNQSGEEATGLEMVRSAAEAFFRSARVEAHGLAVDLWGEIPIEGGLGSSASLRAGVVESLNRFHGEPLSLRDRIALVAALDNAPDNACAVFRGGFCISRTDGTSGDYVDSFRFPVGEDLRFVAISPNTRVKTVDARKALPETLPFAEVVQSLNSLAYLVAAFGRGKYERLRGAVIDHIHMPYREWLNPFAREAIDTGIDAGAYTGWLSGSGSSVICLTDQDHVVAVGQAMEQLYRKNEVVCRFHSLHADNQGIQVISD